MSQYKVIQMDSGYKPGVLRSGILLLACVLFGVMAYAMIVIGYLDEVNRREAERLEM